MLAACNRLTNLISDRVYVQLFRITSAIIIETKDGSHFAYNVTKSFFDNVILC